MTWRFILINDKLIICMKKQILMVLASVPLLVNAQYRSEAWCPDNGNGTYTNPVINADYSDPDACVVGEDYYLTASSFNCAPGLPVFLVQDRSRHESRGRMSRRKGIALAVVGPGNPGRILQRIDGGGHDGGRERARNQEPAPRAPPFIAKSLQSDCQGGRRILQEVVEDSHAAFPGRIEVIPQIPYRLLDRYRQERSGHKRNGNPRYPGPSGPRRGLFPKNQRIPDRACSPCFPCRTGQGLLKRIPRNGSFQDGIFQNRSQRNVPARGRKQGTARKFRTESKTLPMARQQDQQSRRPSGKRPVRHAPARHAMPCSPQPPSIEARSFPAPPGSFRIPDMKPLKMRHTFQNAPYAPHVRALCRFDKNNRSVLTRTTARNGGKSTKTGQRATGCRDEPAYSLKWRIFASQKAKASISRKAA